jgi:DNA-binding MarR family transcriptional regulator
MHYTSYSCFISGKQKIWAGLPNREQQILEAVFRHPSTHHQKVKDLLKCKELGSQATVHAALTRLKRIHLLILTNDEGDGRVKLVSLAPKAMLIFKSLSKLIASCSKK